MSITLYNPSYPEIMTCVYRLYDAAGRLLYVGVAYDFDVRFSTHSKRKNWWPDVMRKDIIWFDNRLDAMYEESRAIRDESPLHNEREGIDPIGLALFYVRNQARQFVELNPARMIVSDFEFERALREVIRTGAHAVVTYEGVPESVIVPTAWVKRVQALVGDPTDL